MCCVDRLNPQESYDVAQAVGQQGIALSPIADDLMTLWYDELDLHWQQAPMTLGGVTMPEALFVLETFALDRGMRVVYRGEHSAVSDGNMTHKLAGPAAMLEWLSHAGTDWTHSLAQAMTQCPANGEKGSELDFETQSDALALRDVPLMSWIIAPRSVRTSHL
jgi:hypothetical protein